MLSIAFNYNKILYLMKNLVSYDQKQFNISIMYFIFVIELKKQFDNKIVGKLNIFQF